MRVGPGSPSWKEVRNRSEERADQYLKMVLREYNDDDLELGLMPAQRKAFESCLERGAESTGRSLGFLVKRAHQENVPILVTGLALTESP